MKQLRQFAGHILFVPFLLSLVACHNAKKMTANVNISSQNVAAKSQPNFLFLSDIHLDTDSTNTSYGFDTGMGLWANFLQKADSILASSNAPKFVIYTGDLPAHYSGANYLPPDGRADHNKNLTAILTGLRNLVSKYNVPLFYMPGNNDGIAGDYYSFADEQNQTPLSLVPETTNPFPALNIVAAPKAPCIMSQPDPQMGYYSVKPIDGLRLICLNTVMYDKKFKTVDGTKADADRMAQIQWLGTELSKAQAAKEKVYIAMHIPPGTDAYSGGNMWTTSEGKTVNWEHLFLSLTTQYQNTISGIFYGHTHMDEVRRLYDSTNSHITEVAISCPGVTPQHHNNPGFKTVSFDKDSKEVTDFITYYTTPQSTVWGSNWYSFKGTYGGAASTTAFTQLSKMPIATITAAMKKIYTVKNGPTSTDVQRGIEVNW